MSRIPTYVKTLLNLARMESNYYLMPSGRSSYPKTIYLNINNVCNLRCKMCDVGQNVKASSFYKNLKSSGQLTITEWKKFIDDIASFQPIIHINGTEPLLYADLFEFIKYVRDKNLHCKITTNGVLLVEYAKQLIDADIQLINVSIDGPQKIHDMIRGVPGTFDKAYLGIKKVIKIKKQLNRNIPDIVVNFTVSNYNYNHLADAITPFDDLDITRFEFGALSFKTKKMVEKHNGAYGKYPATMESLAGVTPKSIDTKKLDGQIKKIKSMYSPERVGFSPDLNCDELKTYYKHPEQFIDSLKRRCILPWFTSQINSNGDVLVTDRCLHTVLGNVKEKSFREIWNDSPYREFRKNLRKTKRYPVCARCGGLF